MVEGPPLGTIPTMALCAPTIAALALLLQASPTGASGAPLDPAPRPVRADGAAPAPITDLGALLAELSRAPRVVGTIGYGRGLDAVEAALEGAGLRPTRVPVTAEQATPTRSDVLLFEDSLAATAFAGLKERWDPGTSIPSPMPAAYDWNPAVVEARGAVVDLGAGLEADFDAAQKMRLSLEGTIALVTVAAAPVARKTSIRAIAARAASRGCVGVLVAPLRPGSTRDDFVLARIGPAHGQSKAELRLPIPCAPLRSAEADLVRARLKVRRVRGAGGKATTIRVGPGPVEAALNIECPVTTVRVDALQLEIPSRSSGSFHMIAADHCPDLALGGAPALAVAVGAAAALGPPLDASTATLWIAPRSAALPAGHGAPGFRLDAALAPRPGTPLMKTFGPLGPSRIAPLLDESWDQLDARLAGQLEPRMTAAVDWIGYSLRGEDEPRRASGARAARALERLLAPLPSER